MKAPRDEIGNALIALAEKNYPIAVVDSDLASSTRTDQFRAKYPERFFEMGIAETSAMSFTTGLALEGLIPFYVNFAMFITGTAWTQLRQACYAAANIKLAGTHPGLDDGPNGASHHALEDLALSRVLPGLTIFTPADSEEVAPAFERAAAIQGPVYIRLAREPMPVRDKLLVPIVADIGVIERSGDDFTIVFEGSTLEQALDGYQQLYAMGKRGKLIHVARLKPFCAEQFIRLIQPCPVVISTENHSVHGGLGGLLAETLACTASGIRLIRIGTADTFSESGNSRQLKLKYGISGDAICQAFLNA